MPCLSVCVCLRVSASLWWTINTQHIELGSPPAPRPALSFSISLSLAAGQTIDHRVLAVVTWYDDVTSCPPRRAVGDAQLGFE